jgi:putative transposase
VIQCLHTNGAKPGEKKVSVQELCVLFEVSRSGYYDHLRKAEQVRRQQDLQLGRQIEAIFQASRESYGSPRLVDALHKQGVRCGKNRIRRLMCERGLEAKGKRRCRPHTTDTGHALPVAPNLLQEVPEPKAINQCWVNDITYIATQEGWLYLAGTLDCYSRRIVGWQASPSLESAVVLGAARRAFATRRPERGLVYHSDRGSQYASRDCQQLLADQGAQQSMSRRGNCYDNAMMESFWATLKTECFGDYMPATKSEAKSMLFDYIEVFYDLSLIMRTRKEKGFPPFADFGVGKLLQTRRASSSPATNVIVSDCKRLRCN